MVSNSELHHATLSMRCSYMRVHSSNYSCPSGDQLPLPASATCQSGGRAWDTVAAHASLLLSTCTFLAAKQEREFWRRCSHADDRRPGMGTRLTSPGYAGRIAQGQPWQYQTEVRSRKEKDTSPAIYFLLLC